MVVEETNRFLINYSNLLLGVLLNVFIIRYLSYKDTGDNDLQMTIMMREKGREKRFL